MKHIEFRAMNCEMSAVLDTDSIEADALLTNVPKWFEAWEQTFSRFRPESELSRLNASAGQVFKASEDLWAVVDLAVRTARTHRGLVTPTVLNALVDAGYDQSFEQVMDVAPSKQRFIMLAPVEILLKLWFIGFCIICFLTIKMLQS